MENPREIIVEEEEAEDQELLLNHNLSMQRIRDLEMEKINLESELNRLVSLNVNVHTIQNTNINYTTACEALERENAKLRAQIGNAQITRDSIIKASMMPGNMSSRQSELVQHLEKLTTENNFLRQALVR